MYRVCFTGHRDIKNEDLTYVKSRLRLFIRDEIRKGATHFICGLAKGVDNIAAKIVIDEKREFPNIVLELAVPYRGRLYSKDPEVREIAEKSDEIFVISESYDIKCYQMRNRFMVDTSEKVAAVYDNRGKGGTFNTIEYAKSKGKEIFLIEI